MSEKHVYFVRHGESEANAAEVDLGDVSVLTAAGRREAERLGDRLRSLADIQVVFSSPYPRAAGTAAEVARRVGAPLELMPLFVQRRRPSCVLGKRHYDDAVREVMEQVFCGYALAGHRHSDEENLDDLRDRTERALAFLEARDETAICVVTHGMFLRAVLCAILGGPRFPGELFQRSIECLEPANGALTYVRREPPPRLRTGETGPVWRLISWNDTAHL
ncbi:MAG TPA: histidine phosphatase family protein [Longimicrobium sp.]|nr:histidine phosphatase family protein [Longimicrobium sp.]